MTFPIPQFDFQMNLTCGDRIDVQQWKKATWGTQYLSFESQEIVVQLQNGRVNIMMSCIRSLEWVHTKMDRLAA